MTRKRKTSLLCDCLCENTNLCYETIQIVLDCIECVHYVVELEIEDVKTCVASSASPRDVKTHTLLFSNTSLLGNDSKSGSPDKELKAYEINDKNDDHAYVYEKFPNMYFTMINRLKHKNPFQDTEKFSRFVVFTNITIELDYNKNTFLDITTKQNNVSIYRYVSKELCDIEEIKKNGVKEMTSMDFSEWEELPRSHAYENYSSLDNKIQTSVNGNMDLYFKRDLKTKKVFIKDIFFVPNL